MVSVAAYGLGNAGSNPGWLAVLFSNKILSFKNNTIVWYSSEYCYTVMRDTLVGGDK